MIKIRYFRIPQYFAEFISEIPKPRKPDQDMLLRYDRSDPAFTPMTRGGLVEVECNDNPDMPVIATAACSLKDNFCYRTGRRIAAGRLDKRLAELGIMQSHPDRVRLGELK